MAMQRISRLAEVISAVFTISRLPIAHPLEGVYAGAWTGMCFGD